MCIRDSGFGVMLKMGACRVLGVDAWEMRGPEKEKGLAARDYVRSVILEGEWYKVATVKLPMDHSQSEKGKYGRYLVSPMLNDDMMLSDELVRLGHAVYKEY